MPKPLKHPTSDSGGMQTCALPSKRARIQELSTTPSERQPSPSSSPSEYASDDSFDEAVENVRKKLKGNDLQSIEAVLIEVWNREMAADLMGILPPLKTGFSEP
jgi:hypothetical protein